MQKFLKRIGVILLALLLVVPVLGASADSISPKRVSLKGASVQVQLKKAEYSKNGYTIPVVVTLKGKTLEEGTDYTVSGNEFTADPGIYRVKITVEGIGSYKGHVSKTVLFTVTKKAQKITATVEGTASAKALQKNSVYVPVSFSGVKGTLVLRGKCGWSVSGNGIKVPKGTKAGTYTVKVTALSTSHYAVSNTVTLKVVVK